MSSKKSEVLFWLLIIAILVAAGLIFTMVALGIIILTGGELPKWGYTLFIVLLVGVIIGIVVFGALAFAWEEES